MSRRLAAVAFVCVLLGLMPGTVRAQNAEDELGNWLIYNGTVRFSDQWSLFTEAQLRLYEVASNVNEVFVRAAGQYHTSPKTLVALGYMRSVVEPFVAGPKTTEDRLYEQFTIHAPWRRPEFDHRFRLEQRWLEVAGQSEYRNRFRYRIQVTTPLNRPTLEPRTHFVNAYNELFLNFGGSRDTFDQNRLYAAYGWQFTQVSNLQLGLLWQARSSADFFSLQIFYTHNFDLRDRSKPTD